MSLTNLVIIYQKMEKEIYGLPSDDLLPNDAELLKLLQMAVERVNKDVDSHFFICGADQMTTKKFISKEEADNFKIFSERKTLNWIALKLALPGDEKKMLKVYAEFFKLMYFRAKADSYNLF